MDYPAQPFESPVWKISINGGETPEATYDIVREITTIGREPDNDISLQDPQVSRYHARLLLQTEHLLLEDLDSANGTVLNGAELAYPTVLHVGDTIALGQHTLTVGRLEIPAQAEPAVISSGEAPPQRRLWPFLLVVMFILAAIVLLLGSIVAGNWLFRQEQASGTNPTPVIVSTVSDRPTIAINQAPVAGTVLPVNQSVTIQATAAAASGVVRLELWVNGQLVEQVESPLSQSATSMASAFRWTAEAPGEYTLQLRAYTEDGQMAEITAASLTVVGETPTPTQVPATATPTITPLPSTATPTFTPAPTVTDTPLPTMTPIPATPPPPLLRVGVPLLNVRVGPGTGYSQVGALQQGDEVVIVSRALVGEEQWWRVEFAPAPGGTAWVSGNTAYVTVNNTGTVPVGVVPLPPTATATSTLPATPPRFTPSPTVPPAEVKRAPPGKTLLIVSNRSLINQPARLTLSGGKSVGGGLEIDPPAGGEAEFVLEPDFYRALWSAPWNSFTRGADFTAVAGKVVVMWIVPEDGVTLTEVYDELVVNRQAPPTPSPVPSATSLPKSGQPVARPGMALLIASNRSVENEFGLLTITGGNYGGGKEIILDANTETQLELVPGYYRTIWHSPARGGVNAGREFWVTAGEVIYGWIIPEARSVFMQFPGQPVEQINN
jgi:hypothetical protein